MKPSIVPGIAELQKDVPPGHCCFCEEPIPQGAHVRRKPIHCGGEECVRSYHRLYAERRTERNWAQGLNARGAPRRADPRTGRTSSQWGRHREDQP